MNPIRFRKLPLVSQLWLFVVLIYLVLVGTKIIQFHIWPSIFKYKEIGWNIGIIWEHKQALRYFLMLPIFNFGKLLQIDVHYIFSLFCGGLIVWISYLVANFTLLAGERNKREFPYYLLGVTFVFIGLSCLMNGRLIWAFAGISLIQLTLLERTRGNTHVFAMILQIIAGLWLCSVSAGTFFIATSIVFLWSFLYFFKFLKNPPAESGDLLIGVGLLLLFVSVLFPVNLLYINKHLAYFGGGLSGFVGMFSHGYGALFLKLGGWTILGLIIFSCGFLGLNIYVWIKISNFRFFQIVLLPSVLGGVFGYSALLIGLPAILSLTVLVSYPFINPVIRYFSEPSSINTEKPH